jgi:hypothetical protein
MDRVCFSKRWHLPTSLHGTKTQRNIIILCIVITIIGVHYYYVLEALIRPTGYTDSAYVKFVRYNLKVSHHLVAMFVIINLQAIFIHDLKGIFMTYLYTTFHIPSSSDSLDITAKQTAK